MGCKAMFDIINNDIRNRIHALDILMHGSEGDEYMHYFHRQEMLEDLYRELQFSENNIIDECEKVQQKEMKEAPRTLSELFELPPMPVPNPELGKEPEAYKRRRADF